MTDVNTLNLLRHEFELYQAGYHYGLAHAGSVAGEVPLSDSDADDFIIKLSGEVGKNKELAAGHLGTAVKLRQDHAARTSSLRRRLSNAIIGAVNGWRKT